MLGKVENIFMKGKISPENVFDARTKRASSKGIFIAGANILARVRKNIPMRSSGNFFPQGALKLRFVHEVSSSNDDVLSWKFYE